MFLFLFLFFLGLKDNHYVICVFFFDIQDQLRKHVFLFLVYLPKSNSVGSIHLSPLAGRNLDITKTNKLVVSKYIKCFDVRF